MQRDLAPDLSSVVDFLTAVGLPLIVRPTRGSFLPSVEISQGGLQVDPGCLVSNVLHEAGHLAIIPGQFRSLADGDLSRCERAMFDALPGMEIDGPLYRATVQSGECEATAWAWAAGIHIGLLPGSIIRDEDYGGDGEAIRCMVATGRYFGVHGLSHAGFCSLRGEGCYPRMRHWIQPEMLD